MNTTLVNNPSWMILNALPKIGPIALKRLMAQFGSDPSKIFEVSKYDLMQVEGIGETLSDIIIHWQNHFDLNKELEYLSKYNAHFIPCISDDYPPLLKEIYDPPIGLYRLGTYTPKLKTIAIVGSRRSTLYGLKVAKQLSIELAQLGFCIISGMARGADSAAHEGALVANGTTIAVLGSGLDIIYPPENKVLYERIQEAGAIITELPFGTPVDKTTFPRRNRIVSGMVHAIIVVETDIKGGSMITARLAGEQGRQVFAVPGQINHPLSQGCHELIRDGAILCRGIDDILEELNFLTQLDTRTSSTPSTLTKNTPTPTGLSPIETKVYNALTTHTTATSDLIAMQTQEPIQTISSTLLLLELKKLITRRTDGTYEINL